MKHAICQAFVLTLVFFEVVALAGQRNSEKAIYLGGTVAGIFVQTEGTLSIREEETLVFTPARDSPPLRITYNGIISLEYGTTAGRRLPVAIVVQKKKAYYLTVNWIDDSGKEQGAVFDLPKDTLRTTLRIIAARSGKEIEYQNEEARRAASSN